MPLEGDRGSAPAEFAMVAGLLTLLLLGVVQLAIALHVRATVLDAAAEGARHAALVGNAPEDGAERTRLLIATAVGADYATAVEATRAEWQGLPVIAVTVRTTLPLVAMLGVPGALEVRGHAVLEPLD